MGETNTLIEKKLFSHIERDSYDTKGFVDYHKLQKNLHIKVKTLASAIGKTTRAIEKNPHSENIQEGLRKIVYIIALLRKMLESGTEILIWLKAPNPDFDDSSPMDVIAQGEIDAVIDYLADIRKGALA